MFFFVVITHIGQSENLPANFRILEIKSGVSISVQLDGVAIIISSKNVKSSKLVR